MEPHVAPMTTVAEAEITNNNYHNYNSKYNMNINNDKHNNENGDNNICDQLADGGGCAKSFVCEHYVTMFELQESQREPV